MAENDVAAAERGARGSLSARHVSGWSPPRKTSPFPKIYYYIQFLGAKFAGWRRGVAVERRTRDREVVSSSLDRALRRKNSGQVSRT